MKTLEEIKDEVASDDNFNSWQLLFDSCAMYDYGRLEEAIDEVAKRYAKEVAREALKNASSHFDEKTSLGQISINVITTESNIPKL